MYQTNNTWSTTFPLDKESKKRYTQSTQMKLKLAAFDDDAVAGSAVDYLYAPSNQSKTQTFLKSNGFPSAQEREFNKAMQGVEQERKNLMNEFKSKVKTPVSTEDYGESDRGFLKGLLGEEEGEREYQKRLANVNAQNAENIRKQNELFNAFKDSPFESLLRPSVPVSGVAQSRTLSATNPTERSVLEPLREYKTTQYIDTKTTPTTATQSGYNDNGNLYAYSGNKSASTTKSNDSGPDGSWKKTGFWPWQRTYQVAPPKWEAFYWNNDLFKDRTNCYAYALNLRVNPRTDKIFGNGSTADFGLPVGMICAGVLEKNQISRGNTVALVRYDVEELGWTMESATLDTPVPEGKWKIAIAIAPGQQYHFYRQDTDGTWSHKPGHDPATQLDASGNIITNPETADRKYKGVNYNVFCGYFIIGPK